MCLCVCIYMHRTQAWTSVLTAIWAREQGISLPEPGGRQLLGPIEVAAGEMDSPVHETGRGDQVGVLQEAVRGPQPGIAAANQRLLCICSSLNLPHVGAGK